MEPKPSRKYLLLGLTFVDLGGMISILNIGGYMWLKKKQNLNL